MKRIDSELAVENDEGTIRVEWYNAGEGYSGDWNPDDPEDVNLLRFDVYVRDAEGWQDPGMASYCTNTPADAEHEILMSGLEVVLRAFADSWSGLPADHVVGDYNSLGYGYKKVLEQMSWIGPDDFAKEKSE